MFVFCYWGILQMLCTMENQTGEVGSGRRGDLSKLYESLLLNPDNFSV